MARKSKPKPLYTGSGADWDFDLIKRTTDAIEEIALGEMKLDVYPNQIEIITSEQMLDAYSSIGMPLMYQHWSFGKHFLTDEKMYRKGYQGLAYEIVINSSPCISYLMEENTMTLQALVIAHAAFGHNHFFKNNYLFQQWTDAEGILDYLKFAKDYIADCEQRYGTAEVEQILDSCHAIMDQGVDRYRRPSKLSAAKERERQEARAEEAQRSYNDLWNRTVPKDKGVTFTTADLLDELSGRTERQKLLKLPEENLLYFIEKKSPTLKPWEREIVRIVRKIAQYFYPQKQTKVANEGFATYTHYHIMYRLWDKGLIDNAAMLEFLHVHTAVVRQPEFHERGFSGLNPYHLGFEMMQDIRRIAEHPTDEDREWFPDWAGSGDGHAKVLEAVANYRDESFIQQFLSPHLIRKLRLFQITDDNKTEFYEVAAIHDDQGYKNIRNSLAQSYNLSANEPDIQVVDVDLLGSRTLSLRHTQYKGIPMDEGTTEEVLKHVGSLWGYSVRFTAVEADSGDEVSELTLRR